MLAAALLLDLTCWL